MDSVGEGEGGKILENGIETQASLSRGGTSQKKWSMWLELQNGRLNVMECRMICRMELRQPPQ